MIKINADQLATKLESFKQQNKLFSSYLLVGAEPYLQHQAQRRLIHYLNQSGFNEHFIFSIDAQTDWNAIYDCSQALSLFSSNTLIILQFNDSGIHSSITTKLNELTASLTPEVILLLSITKLTKAQENSQWYKALSDQMLYINCSAPDTANLPQWLAIQAHQQGLKLEQKAIELLCYYYEGNLLALAQILDQLKLLHPDGKIAFEQVESNINDAAIFTAYHWIDAMLAAKVKRSTHILQQLKLNDVEQLILLRSVQRELLLLINLKKTLATSSIKVALDQFKVWQNRRMLLTNAVNRLSLTDLYCGLNQLAQIEILLKQDYSTSVWNEFADFALLMVGKNTRTVIVGK